MPRLPDPRFASDCAIVVDGRTIPARAGESVTSALLAAGRPLLSRSPKYHRPRGPFCLASSCAACLVRVAGVPNVRACETPCADGLVVETQNVLGSAERDLLGAIDVLAPGLSVYRLPNGVTTGELVDGKTTLAKISSTASKPLPAP